jgi:hypothetical protein
MGQVLQFVLSEGFDMELGGSYPIIIDELIVKVQQIAVSYSEDNLPLCVNQGGKKFF